MKKTVQTLLLFSLVGALVGCDDAWNDLTDIASDRSCGTDADDAEAPAQDRPSEGRDAGADAPSLACNAVPDDGLPVAVTLEPRVAPIPLGGAIHDGTYVLKSATVYAGVGGPVGPSGEVHRMTMRVSGLDGESVANGVRRSFVYVSLGTTLRIVETCPKKGAAEHAYTATASTLEMHVRVPEGTLVYVLSKSTK